MSGEVAQTTKNMAKQLKILFVIRASESYFGFQSIVDSFYKRGHNVMVIFDRCTSRRDLVYWKGIFCKEFDYEWVPHSHSRFRNILLYSRFLLSLRRYYKIKGQSSFYIERWRASIPSRLTSLLGFRVVEKILVSDIAAKVYKFIFACRTPRTVSPRMNAQKQKLTFEG